jgi:hypothetical protein
LGLGLAGAGFGDHRILHSPLRPLGVKPTSSPTLPGEWPPLAARFLKPGNILFWKMKKD